MRIIILAILCYLGTGTAFAQDSVIHEIMKRGIEYHEQGKYDLALVEYNKAKELDPKNAFVNYEMAYTYYFLNDLEKSIKLAEVAAQESSESGLQAVILLGSIYDKTGQPKKSIKVLRKGIDRFGDYYLLWYNLGITATSMNDLVLAQEAFLKSVNNRLDHANSHFALGRILLAQERRVEAIYPLLFCGLIEPDSDRSSVVWSTIEESFGIGVEQTSDSSTTITLNVMGDETNEQMRSAELMMSMMEASKGLEKYDGWEEWRVDMDILASFLNFVHGLDWGDRDDFFTQYYIPLFGSIAGSDHMEPFFHYVRMSKYESSRQYCESYPEELQEFFTWLDTLEF